MTGLIFDGVPIFESRFLEERTFYRKPRSKRRRIVKKWRARSANWRMEPMRAVLRTPMGLIMHPATARRLRAAIHVAAP